MVTVKTYCVTTALINNGGQFFIAKRATSKKIAPGVWEFITGFVEDHEAAEETILRELKEEIDSTGTIIRQLPTIESLVRDEHWIVVPFLVQVADTNIKTTPAEHSEGKWLSWAQLQDMPQAEFRFNLKQVDRALHRSPANVA